MLEKPPFSDPRWNDTSLPKVIGHEEVTKEENERAEKLLEEINNRSRQKAVLKSKKAV